MQITKKLAGVGAGLATASILALPLSASAAARPLTTIADNSMINVQTELDCTTHTLQTEVTNKTGGDITPDVTFDGKPSTLPTLPIPSGRTGTFYDYFSGNHMVINVQVTVNGEKPVVVMPNVACNEPVSFETTISSSSAVVGRLTNNSSLVPQIVITRVGLGDLHIEALAPGESRLIALPFTPVSGQTTAFVTIGTSSGFQSTYNVDLNGGYPGPIHPLAKR